MKLDYLEMVKVSDSLYVNVYLNEVTVFAADDFESLPEIELVDVGVDLCNSDGIVWGDMGTPDHRSEMSQKICDAIAEHLSDYEPEVAFSEEAHANAARELRAFAAETRRW